MILQEGIQVRRAAAPPGEARQVEQIRDGDWDAFRALFLAHYPALCRYVHRYVRSQEVAEDLVQEVFFDLWKRRAGWHPEHAPRAFLYGAVRNQMLNHQRRLRTRPQLGTGEALGALLASEDPEETVAYEDFVRVAARAVVALPPRCRDVFVLSREHELTYAEIAATLGISVKTVESHMARALKHLRDHLAPHRA